MNIFVSKILFIKYLKKNVSNYYDTQYWVPWIDRKFKKARFIQALKESYGI